MKDKKKVPGGWMVRKISSGPSIAIIVNISYNVDVFLNVREIHSILFLGFFALSNYTA